MHQVRTPTLQNKQLPSRAFNLGMSIDGYIKSEIQRHVLGHSILLIGRRCPGWLLEAAVRTDQDLTFPPSTRTSAVARNTNGFRIRFRVEASGSIGPMWSLYGRRPSRARPSSTMSPTGYSLTLLSSKRLRFSGHPPSFRNRSCESIEKPYKLISAGLVGPLWMGATADILTGEIAVVLTRR